jgi:hypothetical protein
MKLALMPVFAHKLFPVPFDLLPHFNPEERLVVRISLLEEQTAGVDNFVGALRVVVPHAKKRCDAAFGVAAKGEDGCGERDWADLRVVGGQRFHNNVEVVRLFFVV